uniref:Uncharacterized protein n=1 Tax=Lepeophtheirus salmonis TaxID=72036 RepID=A0A0K2U9N5_LEPSM
MHKTEPLLMCNVHTMVLSFLENCPSI